MTVSPPHADAQAARRGADGRAVSLGGEAVAGLQRLDRELQPEGHGAAKVLDHGGLSLRRILLGMDANVQLRPRVRRDRVEGVVDRGNVDADHSDGRPAPHAGAERAGAHQRRAVDDLGELAELRLVRAAARPLVPPQTGDGDVAVVVVQ